MGNYKYYAVAKGKKKGVYDSWEACKAAIDGVESPRFKGFDDLEEAKRFADLQHLYVYIASALEMERGKYKDYSVAMGVELEEDRFEYYFLKYEIPTAEGLNKEKIKDLYGFCATAVGVCEAIKYCLEHQYDVLHLCYNQDDSCIEAAKKDRNDPNAQEMISRIYHFDDYQRIYRDALEKIDIVFEGEHNRAINATVLNLAYRGDENIAMEYTTMDPYVEDPLGVMVGVVAEKATPEGENKKIEAGTAGTTSAASFNDVKDSNKEEQESEKTSEAQANAEQELDNAEIEAEQALETGNKTQENLENKQEPQATTEKTTESASEKNTEEATEPSTEKAPEETTETIPQKGTEEAKTTEEASSDKADNAERVPTPRQVPPRRPRIVPPNRPEAKKEVTPSPQDEETEENLEKKRVQGLQRVDNSHFEKIINVFAELCSLFEDKTEAFDDDKDNEVYSFEDQKGRLAYALYFFYEEKRISADLVERTITDIRLTIKKQSSGRDVVAKILLSYKITGNPGHILFACLPTITVESERLKEHKISSLSFELSKKEQKGNAKLLFEKMDFLLSDFFSANHFNYVYAENLVNTLLDEEQLQNYIYGFKKKCNAVDEYVEAVNDANSSQPINVSRESIENILEFLIGWIKKSERNTREADMPMLPSLAFMGEPGTGKTELARRIAENILGARFKAVTPADMKGQYIGHTGSRITDIIEDLQNSCTTDKQPAVLFIDEAYELFASEEKHGTDSFAAEAVSTLLPILSNRPYELTHDKISGNAKIARSVMVRKNFTIWIAGYEKQLRKALSTNPGMKRRFEDIVLESPTNSELWTSFMNKWKDESTISFVMLEEDAIKDFFKWGCSKQYNEFFGNYAGIQRFITRCQNRIWLTEVDSIEDKEQKEKAVCKIIEDVIRLQKEEIRKQYITVIEQKIGRPPFKVASDIEENLGENYYQGYQETKGTLQDIIRMLLGAKDFSSKKLETPKGALLVGPPGTGKTFLAKCMAGELEDEIARRGMNAKVGFIPTAASKLRNAEAVQALFGLAEEFDIAIVFIDEIDLIGAKRSANANVDCLIQLLDSLDGFDKAKSVFVLAATNNPDILDPALVRAGRFDLKLDILPPDKDTRKKIIKQYFLESSDESLVTEEHIEKISKLMKDMSPADIKAIINATRLRYYTINRDSNRDGEVFNTESFIKDLDEVITQRELGTARKLDKTGGFSLKKNVGLSATAVHEVGHALIHILNHEMFDKITVLGRGDFGGYVESSIYRRSKSECLKSIECSLGGRAAEEVIYGEDEISWGAAQDIQNVTSMAKRLILLYGMDDEFGMYAGMTLNHSYLGSGYEVSCSEEQMARAEKKAMELLRKRYDKVKQLLTAHKADLIALAEYVYDKETLFGEEFVQFIRDNNLAIDLSFLEEK